MRCSTLAFAVSLVTTVITTSSHRYQHKHHVLKHGSVSGIPYPGGNATTLAGSSIRTLHLTSTIIVTAYSAQATDTVPTSQSAAAEEKLVVNQSSAASTDACNQDTVTVTYNPTTTITVSASPSESPSIPTPILAVLVSSNPVSQQASSPLSAFSGRSPSSIIEQTSTTSIPSLEQPASPPAPESVTAITAQSLTSLTPSLGDVSTATILPTSASSPHASPSNSPQEKNAGIRTKRGIIASGSDQTLLVGALTPYTKISWLGDWYSGPPTNLPSTMQFVPQNYGRQSDTNGEWTSNAQKAVAAGDKYMLSFGEPGTPNAQLYMDPQDAVTLFMTKMQPYAEQGVSIGAPGTLQNDQDFAWLTSFLDLCDKAGCKIGFLAMHWFWIAEADHVQGFKDTVAKNVALAKGRPIWVDNFQATGSVEAQKQFLGEVVPWLDAQDQVARYAYVPVDRGTGEGFLNDGDGKVSELGIYYANL